MEDGTVEKFVFGLWRDTFFSMLVFFSYVYIMLHFVPVTVRFATETVFTVLCTFAYYTLPFCIFLRFLISYKCIKSRILIIKKSITLLNQHPPFNS